jgi:glycosyltransferase involved in cell wall biosynthesis/4-amino-4-deoxy-L-arabinose transferase-like glycosyltransferase
MKIVLVTLSGDAETGRSALSELYPDAEIVELQRSAIEKGTMLGRLAALRAARPDVFAVMTESIAWQYGQEALMLFGALAGAGESVIIDARGGLRRAGRVGLLATAPAMIARGFMRGRMAFRRAARQLGRLEGQTSRAAANAATRRDPAGPVSITYLRATPAAGTQPGGATSHINGVVSGLLSLGSKITFISNDEIAGLDKSEVDFKLIGPEAGIMPRAAFDVHNGSNFSERAAEMIAASPPDFIYQRYCRFSWAGVEASVRTGVPLFLEYNGSEVWIGKHWDRTEKLDLLERCEHLNLRAATKIFVISEVERNNLLAAGVDGHKIVVNPNGVDINVFRPGIGGEKERAKMGISDDTILVGFVGSFGPWHGVLALADAIALIPKDANIHFLLIGDGSLRGEVERKLRETGDLARVTFTGVVKHGRVPVLLDACDILVSPHVPLADGSKFFGSPTKLFEYMAMGKGIVASRLAQIGDVLSDGETAILVEPGNVDELGAAIKRLGDAAALRSRMGTAASAVRTRPTYVATERSPSLRGIRLITEETQAYHPNVRARALWIAGIIALSFLVRAGTAQFVGTHLDDAAWFQFGSYRVFDERARKIIDGAEPAFFLTDPGRTDLVQYPPAFPIVVGLIYEVTGERSAGAVMRVLWPLDALVMPLLIIGIAVTAFGWRAGLAAGLFAALSPLLAFYGVTPSADGITTLLVVAAVWLLLLAERKGSWRLTLVAGIVLGVACWFRVNPLFIVVFWAAAVIMGLAVSKRARLALCSALIIGTTFTVAPIVIRNFAVYREFVPTGLSIGVNLWEGLGETEFGRENGFLFGDDLMVQAERIEMGLPADYPIKSFWPDGIRRDRERARRSLLLIARHPVWYAGVMLTRMYWMLKITGDPGPYYGTAGINCTPAKCLAPQRQGGPLALGVTLMGMVQSLYRALAMLLAGVGIYFGFVRNRPMTWLLLTTFLYYLVTSSTAHTELRYVVPMHAVLVVFGGLGFAGLVGLRGRRRSIDASDD